MSLSDILTLAKQGNLQAISIIMNRLTQRDRVTTKVVLQGDRLHVLLESAQLPSQQTMVSLVHKVVTTLQSKPIKTVRIYARQSGRKTIVWSQDVELEQSLDNQLQVREVQPTASSSMLDEPQAEAQTAEVQTDGTIPVWVRKKLVVEELVVEELVVEELVVEEAVIETVGELEVGSPTEDIAPENEKELATEDHSIYSQADSDTDVPDPDTSEVSQSTQLDEAEQLLTENVPAIAAIAHEVDQAEVDSTEIDSNQVDRSPDLALNEEFDRVEPAVIRETVPNNDVATSIDSNSNDLIADAIPANEAESVEASDLFDGINPPLASNLINRGKGRLLPAIDPNAMEEGKLLAVDYKPLAEESESTISKNTSLPIDSSPTNSLVDTNLADMTKVDLPQVGDSARGELDEETSTTDNNVTHAEQPQMSNTAESEPADVTLHQADNAAQTGDVLPENVLQESDAAQAALAPTDVDQMDLMQSVEVQELLRTPEAVVLVAFAIVLLLWQAYVDLLEETAPTDVILSGRRLAQRLGVDHSTISRRKNREDFSDWTQCLDPEGIAWVYQEPMFVPRDLDALNSFTSEPLEHG